MAKNKRNTPKKIKVKKTEKIKTKEPDKIIVFLQKNPIKLFCTFVIIAWLLLILIPLRKGSEDFSCDIIPGDKFSVSGIKYDSIFSTSPICGCLNNNQNHTGTLMYAREISIEKKGDAPQINYLVTAPSYSVAGPVVCFSFNCHLYRIKNKPRYDIFPQRAVEDLISNNCEILDQYFYHSYPYISIVSNEKIYVYPKEGYLPNAVSYRNGELTDFSVSITKDPYTGEEKNITLTDKYDANKYEPEVYMPRLDVLGDTVALVWQGPVELFSEVGHVYPSSNIITNKKITGDQSDIVNIMMIDPPFATRITTLPWGDRFAEYQKAKLQEKIIEKYNALDVAFLGEIPFLAIRKGNTKSVMQEFITRADDPSVVITKDSVWIMKSGEAKLIDLTSDISKYEIPNYVMDYGEVIVNVSEFLSDEECETLLPMLSKKYYWPNSDTSMFSEQTITLYDGDEDIKKRMSNLMSIKTDDADQQEHIGREVKNLRNFLYPVETIRNRTPITDTLEFRYPFATNQNTCDFYNKFTEITFYGATGYILKDNLKISIGKNDLLEIKNIQEANYNYPSVQLNINKVNNPTFSLNGSGAIYVNGVEVTTTFFQRIQNANSIFILTLIFSLLGISAASIREWFREK